MSEQRNQRRVRLIAKERPFDEAKWRELLTAFAYVLHEQRPATAPPLPQPPERAKPPERPEAQP